MLHNTCSYDSSLSVDRLLFGEVFSKDIGCGLMGDSLYCHVCTLWLWRPQPKEPRDLVYREDCPLRAKDPFGKLWNFSRIHPSFPLPFLPMFKEWNVNKSLK